MTNVFRTTRPLAALALAAALLAGCSTDTPGGPSGATGPDLLLTSVAVTQADRFGLPAVATVFIPSAQRDAYNTAQPVNDRANFRSFVVNGLTAFGHPNPGALADALLPDIQPIDLTQPSGFLNGRRLQDDVITAELGLIFGANAALNDDHVDANDKAFLASFPYLAAPFTP